MLRIKRFCGLSGLTLLVAAVSVQASQQPDSAQARSALKEGLAELYRATSSAPILEVGNGVSKPTLLKHVLPPNPPTGPCIDGGSVEILLVIKEDGNVGPALVLRSLRADRDKVALEAVKQWQFAPATKDGSPVPIFLSVAMKFSARC